MLWLCWIGSQFLVAPRFVESWRPGIAGIVIAAPFAGRREKSGHGSEGARQISHLPVPIRWPEPYRHVRYEARGAERIAGAAKASLDQGRWDRHQRTSAAPGQSDGQGDPDPVDASHDEESQPGFVLCADR